MQHLDLGHATLSSTAPVIAGSWVSLTWTYTTGHPIDDTGCLKIAFRFAGDFGRPQFTDPKAANYCTVTTTGQCRIEPRWDPQGHTRPWGPTLYLRIMAGYLDQGEQVAVVFGDRTGGSPGWQAQTFCEASFEFKSLVDPIATVRFKELPISPAVAIVPGAPAKAVCLAPSWVLLGQPFTYHLKLEDAWGNPCARPTPLPHAGLATVGYH